MKKFVVLALCLCAVVTVGFLTTGVKEQVEPEEVSCLAEGKDLDVTEGSEDEGIFLLTAVAGK